MSEARCAVCKRSIDECGMLAKLSCCGGHHGAYCGHCIAGHKAGQVRDQIKAKIHDKGRELVEDLGVLFDDFFGRTKP